MDNQNYTKLDENKLADGLEKWFNNNQVKFITDKNFWARNPVGKMLKSKLKSLKKWKNGPRGKHIKGQWTKANLDDFDF